MPIYEYHCTECGSVFEKLTHGGSEDPENPTCTSCGSSRVSQVFSSFATITAPVGCELARGAGSGRACRYCDLEKCN